MTVDEATKVLQFLAASFRVDLTEMQAAVWFDTLAPLPYAEAIATARRIRDRSDFFPSHAEFLRVAAEFRTPLVAICAAATYERADRLPPDEAHARFDAMRALLPQNRRAVAE